MRIPPTRGRRRGLLLLLLIVALLLLLSLARFYTDVLWFQEVGLSSVLFKSLSTQFSVGIVVGLVVGGVVYLNLWLAGRIGPVYRLPRADAPDRPDPAERYREMVTPYLRWIRLAVAAVVGLLSGLGASGAWQNYLLWANRVDFGVEDPQFGRDIGFYVFELPFLNDITDYLWFAFMAALVLSAIAHYLQGSIRPDIGLRGLSPGVLAHLSVLLGCLALVKAAQYYLGTFALNFSPRGVVTGASYTDVNAQLPALRLLMIISIISAALFLVNIRFRRLALPVAAVGIWILTAVLAGGLWPALVQRFSVEPQELVRERPFIARNIEATRLAFELDDVETVPFAGSADLDAAAVESNNALLQNVRLWSPPVLQRAYTQLQAIRTYYGFEDVDIDRYEVNNETRQVLLSARELELDDLPEESRNWANQHLQYTHGYGLVASLANETTPAGQPEFLIRNVPGTVAPGAESLEPTDQARIYYGESFDPSQYSIVNSGQAELDYPTSGEPARSNYAGAGGVTVGGFFRELLFAIRETDPNIILSNLVRGDSRILLYRNVRDRVLRAAPFLALDGDPYPAVIDGRVKWFLDAYTSTEFYPYSQRFNLDEVTGGDEAGSLGGLANYVRNSVKVVVDAYDGTMDFYIIDEDDPLIQAWRNAFPDLFSTEPPSEELRAHFRYPEDLFNVQTGVYRTYHMTVPDDFFAREDEWQIPNSASDVGEDFAPTYLLATLPGETEEEFVLTRPFSPRARDVMISLMVARSDPANYGELNLFQFPSSNPPLGPVQVDNIINQDIEISRELSLLRQGGSNVELGSLVILPIEESILYVQPLFVTATSETGGIPELGRVVLVLGEEVVFADTFGEALATLFGITEPIAGVDEPVEEPPVGEQPVGEQPDGEQPDGGEPDGQPTGGQPAGSQGRLADLIAQASRIYDRAQQALQAGDFETYGRLINRLGNLLEEAQGLSE
jgi:uncharacterized membrane protein (UPF0182 family)